MNRRILGAVAAAGLLASATAASATTYRPNPAAPVKPQLVDAAGDALAGQKNSDILAGRFSTVGEVVTKVVRGKKVTTYTPKKLVATMTLAAPPSTQKGWTYNLTADIAGCGSVNFAYSPGAAVAGGSAFFFGCGDPSTVPGDSTPSSLITLDPEVKGNTITWDLGLKAMPREIKVGSKFSNFGAVVDVNEPVFGIVGPGVFGVHLDSGSGSGVWKLG
jgi:hypothetical protein